MKNNKLLAAVIGLSISALSCNKIVLEKDAPRCIKTMIRSYTALSAVEEWRNDAKAYYYFKSSGDDFFHYLFDENCKRICAPDGGIGGNGEGNCPQFTGNIEKTIIWKKN